MVINRLTVDTMKEMMAAAGFGVSPSHSWSCEHQSLSRMTATLIRSRMIVGSLEGYWELDVVTAVSTDKSQSLHSSFLSWVLHPDIYSFLEKDSWEGEFTLRRDSWAGLIASCGSFYFMVSFQFIHDAMRPTHECPPSHSFMIRNRTHDWMWMVGLSHILSNFVSPSWTNWERSGITKG